MTKLLNQTLPALDDEEAQLPYVTRETLAYAMTLGVWSVCLKADDDMFKGRTRGFLRKGDERPSKPGRLAVRGNHQGAPAETCHSGYEP